MTRPPAPTPRQPFAHAPDASRRALLLGLSSALLPSGPAWASVGNECIAPSRPGGGFDLTCTLAAQALHSVQPEQPPLITRYLPGGIGAVAFDHVATGRLGGPRTLVAFSSGSLLNLVQGRFGPHPPTAARWIATLATDYGIVAVRAEAPYQNLQDLLSALGKAPGQLVFGAGGTLGSQDWFKAALLVRASGQDHRRMRFVAFEGGGEALKALRGGHVDLFTGDAAEVLQARSQGMALRILAILAPARLAGPLQGLPTAREQNIDLVWPTVRGVYMAASAPPAAAQAWAAAFEKACAAPGYAALCQRHNLYPHPLTGPALDAFIERSFAEYRQIVQQLELRHWPRAAP